MGAVRESAAHGLALVHGRVRVERAADDQPARRGARIRTGTRARGKRAAGYPRRVVDQFSPAEILRRARWVYASCLAYQDRGEVVTRIAPVEQKGLVDAGRMPFSTAFVRPDRFRFEWAEAEAGPENEWQRALILWNAEGVRSSWSLGAAVESHATVHDPLHAHTGVSHCAALTVPTLLIPGGMGRDPLADDGVTVRGRAHVGDRDCFELRKSHELGTSALWIDCAAFLLRRIVETDELDRAALEKLLKSTGVELEPDFPALRSETTTTYEPLVDVPIEEERFAAPAEWPLARRKPGKG